MQASVLPSALHSSNSSRAAWFLCISQRCFMVLYNPRLGKLQSGGSQRVGHDWATEQQQCERARTRAPSPFLIQTLAQPTHGSLSRFYFIRGLCALLQTAIPSCLHPGCTPLCG